MDVYTVCSYCQHYGAVVSNKKLRDLVIFPISKISHNCTRQMLAALLWGEPEEYRLAVIKHSASRL